MWLLIALVAVPFAAGINDRLDTSVRLEGSDSARVDAALQQQFKSPYRKIALLRIAGAPTPRSAGGRALLGEVTDAIRHTAGVQDVMSYLDREDGLFIGRDESPVVVVGVSFPTTGSTDTLMANLRRTTVALKGRERGQYPTLDFEWTGEAAVNADLRRMSAEETRMAELRVLPITLALLLLAFRSVIAAIVPLLCGALTILVSLAAIAVVNRFWPVSVVVYSIISMVGLGLSIDYALLIVTRYRAAVALGLSRPEAVLEAAQHAGRTVLVSGTAVGIGFGAMLIVPVSEVRSIGLAGLVVTTVAVMVARTLLPAVLASIGPWIDAGRLSRRFGPHTDALGVWRSWADWIGRHPVVVLVVAGGPLVLLAAQAAHLRTDLPRGRWLPDSAESVRVLHQLDDVARGNFGQLIPVILRLPQGTTIADEAGWRAASRLVRFFAHDARLAHVWAVTTLNTVPLGGPEILERIPGTVRRSLVSADGRAVLLQLLPRPGLAPTDAASLVREIRAANPKRLTALAGTGLEVGGVPGFNVDYEDAIKHSMVTIVSSVIGATLLVLSLAFRSVLIPVKAVALNLLSVTASFGAVAVVFQSPLGSRLVGLPRPLDGGFPIIPILVFCIVFGLSMDYEVFIVARIAEGRKAGLTDRAALAEGLAGSGRVITFAAAIMVTIFGGFIFGNFVLIKILGFALGVAVLLDATVVRLGLGPALIHLAGRWNWWPGAHARPASPARPESG